MKDMNKVFLLGRLGGDPEIRSTRNGLSVARLSLATARRIRDVSAGEGAPDAWRDETQWHRIIAWGKLAENVQRLGKKGMTVLVEGTIRSRRYDDREGKPQFSFEVHADEMSFLGGGKPASDPAQEMNVSVARESIEEPAAAEDLPY
jgi:single-strand DNA-binding protein